MSATRVDPDYAYDEMRQREMEEREEELAYIEFCKDKRGGQTATAIVWHYGSRMAARFELRWQAEQAAERIFRESCPPPSREELLHFREPMRDSEPCDICHRKHCAGNCDGGDMRSYR